MVPLRALRFLTIVLLATFLLYAFPVVTASKDLRVALAGGLAGATGTIVLHPVDTAKTMRQQNPTKIPSVSAALVRMFKPPPSHKLNIGPKTIGRVYRGVVPAALGAVPSSALYFGSYESVKRRLTSLVLESDSASMDERRVRVAVHGISAACGNAVSSAVFVPKEFVKQKMQSTIKGSWLHVVRKAVQEEGVAGLYCGYRATLARNIPSAICRFGVYEELRLIVKRVIPNEKEGDGIIALRNVGNFVCGACAGAVASAATTPLDVIKTQMTTGVIPREGIVKGGRRILASHGLRGLYAGAEARMVWSAAFSAVGFGTFEFVKGKLGVGDE
ncbi:hypothetical protein TrRE_jg3993 [Triparma retinervis]|uniref:Mitochondrial carrier protein n=1 Tax=Triparma retinervis TaxID=2557542 RepID=A0A9W7A083_9STRA|nr:hypothetical protein TrRE_jg3993 [Triparma retinervis]